MRDRICRNLLYFDDFLRTSSLPGWRATAQYIMSFGSMAPEQKLRAAANYLMHQPHGTFSRMAIRQANASAARVAQKRMRTDSTSIIRSAILKSSKSTSEPGVILVSFETELRKILTLRRYEALQQNYRICFMPTWQNFFCPEVIELDVQATVPYYLLPSCFMESSLRPMLGPHCRIFPFHAASWVNHKLFRSPPVTKDIDIIMLANFSRFKRHWKLFEAIASLPDDLRVVLVGVPLHGRDKDCLLQEARMFNVAERVTIIEDPRQQTLRNLLERSKLMCALSHREGCYVGVAEALMANTPVAMFANAMIGTKAYINEQTGFLLDANRALAEQLAEAIAISATVQPRDWATENISAQVNCRRLNSYLKEDFQANGNSWSEDISNFYSIRFEFYHGLEGDTNVADYADDYALLTRDFGLTIERPIDPAAVD